jgi:MFS family permease
LAAERLLAPSFGTTLDLWSIVIGLTFTFLSIGYAVGGRLIDRRPTHRVPALCLVAAGAWTLVIALFGRPIVEQIQEWTFDFGEVRAGVFFSTLLLFTLPPLLLGVITPAAIRLTVPRVGAAGSSAGMIYALGTLGSLLGTFTPVIVLLPRIGVRYTFTSMAVLALVVGGLGLTRWVRETTDATVVVASHSHRSHLPGLGEGEVDSA